MDTAGIVGRAKRGLGAGPGRVALDLYYALSGRGGRFLDDKRSYHQARVEAERRLLDEARSGAPVLRDNHCPVCGERRARSRFSNPVGFEFVECDADGTVYMDPVPTDETLARLYNDPAETRNFLRTDGTVRARPGPAETEDLEALLRLTGGAASGRLLDVGCATGAFLAAASEAFAVEGVELSDPTAEQARRAGFTVRTGSVAALVPEGPRFDVVTMRQLIEHIVEPVPFLAEARALLRPGGLLFLNTPAVDSASFSVLRAHHVHVASFAHVSLFTRDGLARAVEKAGYELVAHERCFGLDLALHDVLTWAVARDRFSHRHALYSSRLYYASDLVERGPVGWAFRRLLADDRESYQRIVARRI